ncbi:MAG TPA: phosphotransferase [Chthonomonadaceae bacterium]|nr:phosphotransferase [Chthonomonadaceae bacterium]
MSEAVDKIPTQSLLTAAERILSGALGGPVRLEDAVVLRASDHSAVLRAALLSGPSQAPRSVILKRAGGDAQTPYDPEEGKVWGPAWRLFNDWAGAHLLTTVGGDPLNGPRLYGGDRTLGLIVLEDLGEGESLADALLGSDPQKAESALMAFAAALGRMHAATIGRAEEYRQFFRGLGAADTDLYAEEVGRLEENPRWDPAACESVGLDYPAEFDAEARTVLAAMRDPGPFLAYTHGDPCPDNNRLLDGQIRFFDFETGGFRHALLDGVYARVPFPTCWCVNRLPAHLPSQMEAVYRAEFAKGCPQAEDDFLFARSLTEACALWCLRTVSWPLAGALKEDSTWGISTIRQRILMRLDGFAETTEQFGHLPVMGATARDLASRLRAVWPDADAMPLYPAFRS